ncbi:MAG TPA: hypothetical protein VEQ66_05920 [Propionibacteriaceae bacterium]|nr:hypothetical protein [Propionibacteriaceae bacterium]
MKFRTMLASAFGVGVGYVLGAAAGRERFEQIKSQAQRIVTDPEVRQKVADLPTQVKENLPKAQSVVSDKVQGAKGKTQDLNSDADLSAPSAFDTPATSFDEPVTSFDSATTTLDEPVTSYETTTVDSTFDAPATTFDSPSTDRDDRL